MYLHEDKELMDDLVAQTAVALGRDERYVTKDYFAVMMLKEIAERNPDVVFKGGTSLSKCYGAIARFSEDIDLGIPFEHATEGMRKKMKYAVVESAEALGLSIANLGLTRSRREYNRYELPLPWGALGNGDVLLVETAVMTPAAPCENRPLQSFIGQFLCSRGFDGMAADLRLNAFTVKANSMERTFADKVFAICDYYLSGDIPDRQSRHIYDLYKLIDRVSLDQSMAELVEEVRRQRKGNPKCLSAEDGVSVSNTLREIVGLHPYRADYERLTVDLLYEDVSYETAAPVLLDIARFLESAAARQL